MTLYRKVLTKDRLPDKSEEYITSLGVIEYNNTNGIWDEGCSLPTYWLEPIKLPTDEEIEEMDIKILNDKDGKAKSSYLESAVKSGFKAAIELLWNKK